MKRCARYTSRVLDRDISIFKTLFFISKLEKEHVQLRFGVNNHLSFENSGPNWSKLGSLVDNILRLIDLVFG